MSKDTEKIVENLAKKLKWYKILAIVFFILIFVVGFWSHIEERREHSPSSKFSLIDPAREFISQENFIINIQPLREYLSSLGEKYPDNISVYYEQLNSGANISVNKDLKLYVASMIKLPIAMVAVKQVEKGVWSWDTKFTIQGEDVDQDSGNLYKNTINFDPENDTLTVEQLLNALLVESDNTAQSIFVRNIPKENFDEFEEEIGLKEVFDDTGHASAKEYSRILRSLYTSSFLQRKNSQKILELLSKSEFKNFLSTGVPADITFAHKYGENANENIFADTGIVYIANKPYMITVILKSKDTSEESIKWAKDLMHEISKKAYEVSK